MTKKIILFISAMIILMSFTACSSPSSNSDGLTNEVNDELSDKTNTSQDKETNPPDIISGENKNISMVSLGVTHSFVVTSDGELFATGENKYGQLGTGETSDGSKTFIKVMDNIRMADAYSNSGSFAINNNDELLFWGHSNYFSEETLTPVKVMDNVEKVCVGAYAVQILTKEGDLYGVGKNTNGELNAGAKDIEYENPEKIASNVADMSLHYENLIYVTLNGEVFITHSEFDTTAWESLPYEWIKLGDNGKSVSAGYTLSLFVSDNNDLYGYGRSRAGNMGRGHEDAHLETTLLKSGIKKAWADYEYSLIISTENILYGSGNNYRGNYLERGDDISIQNEYTKIMDNVVDVCANNGSNMLITADGELYVSGWNKRGELGMGDIERVDGFTKVNIQ